MPAVECLCLSCWGASFDEKGVDEERFPRGMRETRVVDITEGIRPTVRLDSEQPPRDDESGEYREPLEKGACE